MDLFLIIAGAIFLVLGLIGCVLPVLPGPPLAFVGLVLLHFTTGYDVPSAHLWTAALLAAAITALDYYLPIWGTRKLGGTRRGIWGSTVGLVLGLLFFPPLGIIIGPFIGAFVGELTDSDDVGKALRSALGSLVGFFVGTMGKVLVTLYIIGVFILSLWF